MLQYLLNVTGIWLLSLVLFDLFLRRESFHGYNRSYLLATILLGVLLPLCELKTTTPICTATIIEAPARQITNVKQNIVHQAAASSIGPFPEFEVKPTIWDQYALWIYLPGVLFMALLLIVDIIKLIRLNRRGIKHASDNWKVVETHSPHTPFSVFNLLFVDRKAGYNDEQWQIILQHEMQHRKLFHFADLLVLQFARIIFWFHPLVYIYNRRLLLVHEYQADNTTKDNTHSYGTFLVEQALLGSAPGIAHSLNRSPIRNRIKMLTHRSPILAKVKMFVFIPMVFISVICFTQNSYSFRVEKGKKFVRFKGNEFEMADSATRMEWCDVQGETGKQYLSCGIKHSLPVKMNGEKIYNINDLDSMFKSVPDKPYFEPVLDVPGSLPDGENGLHRMGIEHYLLDNLTNELAKLEDGTYYLVLRNIVVSKAGKIVYWEYRGITTNRHWFFSDTTYFTEKDITQVAISKKVHTLVPKIHFRSCFSLGDEPFNFLLGETFPGPTITVEHHRVKYKYP